MLKVLSGIAAFLLCFVLITSCIKDECGSTVCNNNGVCVKGICTCPTGYEGETCNEKWTDKFENEWKVEDREDTLSYSYSLNVYEQVKDTFFVIGFRDSLDTVYCHRVSNYEFAMIAKTFSDTTQKLTSGAGKLDNSTGIVTGLYSFAYDDSVVTTNFTWTK